MVSRYDFMKESNVRDIDGDTYPDISSVNYSDVRLTKRPTAHQMSIADINKFWYTMYKHYGVCEWDDILLNINGIPYLGMMNPGDWLAMIDFNDLQNFNEQKIKGAK